MNDNGHIHLDVVGGVSGDMFVAALLDALPELRPRVFEDLAAVIPDHAGRPVLCAGLSGGIAVQRFSLESGNHAGTAPGQQGHGDVPDEHEHGHGTSFRHLAQRISAARLHAGTAPQSIAIRQRLAEAESSMHRVPLDAVHFHEIADRDSLMDVVAAGSIAAALSGYVWSVSSLPAGGGLVKTRHGVLPVPAPATTALLRGFCWHDDGVGGERVTPTGGAILAHLVGPHGLASGQGRLRCAGTGAGTRSLPGLPNILRALVFEADDRQPDEAADAVIVLGFDIDDMSGEEIGIAAERLRALPGVLDLSIGNRQGKKGRPVADFRLLIVPAAREAVSRACFLETSTIGLRWHREQRFCLKRSDESFSGEGLRLRRKRVARPDGSFSCKVESDDLEGRDGLAGRRRLKALGEQQDDGM